MWFHLVGSFVIFMVYVTSAVTEAEKAQPVFVTPYIERGMILEARRLARAKPLTFNTKFIKSYSGYFTVDHSTDSNLFFWYISPLEVSTRSYDVPVILWLQGGPGVSSLLGAMFMNGPYKLNFEGPPTFNNYTWANEAHLLFIDNPVGVGFSFTTSNEGYSRNEAEVGLNLYTALVQFFTLFPRLQKNPLIITGESFAGKYLPALGITIHKNNPYADFPLNLQGISIGNGWIDPINMMDFGDIMFHIGLLDTKGRNLFNAERDKVLKLMSAGNLKAAFPIYERWILGDFTPYPTMYQNLTGLDTYYNFMMMGKTPAHHALLDEFFNKETTKLKFNVGNRKFRSKNNKVAKYLRYDILTSNADWLATLMENYRVLIYSGQLDIKCAFALTENMLNNLEWDRAEEFREADRQFYCIEGELVGYVKTVGKFTQILIRNAGHMVPQEKPQWTNHMMYTFARNLPFHDISQCPSYTFRLLH